MAGTGIAVGVDESTPLGVAISALEIIEPGVLDKASAAAWEKHPFPGGPLRESVFAVYTAKVCLFHISRSGNKSRETSRFDQLT